MSRMLASSAKAQALAQQVAAVWAAIDRSVAAGDLSLEYYEPIPRSVIEELNKLGYRVIELSRSVRISWD